MKHLSTLLQIIALLWLSTSWSVAGFVINPYRFGSPPAPPPGGDEYFANVVLLLHADGSDGSTTFTDSSSYAHSVTVIGNAQIDTADKKYGSGSALFDGTGDALEVGANSAFALGTNDFTFEMWIKPVTLNSNTTAARLSSGNGFAGVLFMHASTGLYLTSTGTSWNMYANANAFTGMVTGVWQHIALSRSGSTFRAFVNGVQTATFTSSASIFQASNLVRLGAANSSGAVALNGAEDDIRLTIGVSRYNANFTPPAAAFPDS